MTEDHTAAQWANASAQRVRPSPGKVGNLAIASRGQETSASRGRSVVTLLIHLENQTFLKNAGVLRPPAVQSVLGCCSRLHPSPVAGRLFRVYTIVSPPC